MEGEREMRRKRGLAWAVVVGVPAVLVTAGGLAFGWVGAAVIAAMGLLVGVGCLIGWAICELNGLND